MILATLRHLPAAAFALALTAATVAYGHGGTSSSEVRALWVTRATLSSPEAIAQMVRDAKAGGFNTLIVQVRGRGDAYYRSGLEPRAEGIKGPATFDPLAEVLARAKRAGLAVHAWVNLNLVSSAVSLPASRQHVVYRRPDWLMVPRGLAAEMLTVDPRSPEYIGRLARWARANPSAVEGLYISPLHPAAAAHLVSVVSDLASNYALDGIHLDYVRFPSEAFDYSPMALEQFRRAVQTEITDDERRRADAAARVDPLAYTWLFADQWVRFRQSRLTALVMQIRSAVRAANPHLLVSAAVVPDAAEAAAVRLQDWRTWVDQSLIDVLCPMAYANDIDAFEEQIQSALAQAGPRPVWIGVGAYRLTSAATLRHIAAARRQNAAGVILFSYDALVTPPNSATSLAELGRAAFGNGSS